MKISSSPDLTISVISLFPEIFDALNYGICGRAIKSGRFELNISSLRDYTTDKHRTVDDRPFGGGPGMVLMADPIRKAIAASKALLGDDCLTVYLSPQGKVVNQSMLNKFMTAPKPLCLLAGRYEGVDERVIQRDIDEEWSVGDVILSGGEFAALTIIDAMSRLIPGVLGCQASAENDSFMNGLLDHPHYTRPAVTSEGETIPEVLGSGDHKKIEEWRLKQALGKTYEKRPDLLANKSLSEYENYLLNEYLNELNLRSRTDV
jgi:tRNA (guanine37-N1)-methyltransferase